MDVLQQILGVIGAITGIVATAIAMLVPLVKNIKARQAMEKVGSLAKMLLPAIEKAESFVSYSGDEKKSFVMKALKEYALENNIPFDEAQVDVWIETVISATKKINPREKDDA